MWRASIFKRNQKRTLMLTFVKVYTSKRSSCNPFWVEYRVRCARVCGWFRQEKPTRMVFGRSEYVIRKRRRENQASDGRQRITAPSEQHNNNNTTNEKRHTTTGAVDVVATGRLVEKGVLSVLRVLQDKAINRGRWSDNDVSLPISSTLTITFTRATAKLESSYVYRRRCRSSVGSIATRLKHSHRHTRPVNNNVIRTGERNTLLVDEKRERQ